MSFDNSQARQSGTSRIGAKFPETVRYNQLLPITSTTYKTVKWLTRHHQCWLSPTSLETVHVVAVAEDSLSLGQVAIASPVKVVDIVLFPKPKI